jgi:hypothetical protein
MNSGSGNGPLRLLERLALWLILAGIGLQLLASVLPRLLIPIVVLGGVFVAVRLTLFHTRRW